MLNTFTIKSTKEIWTRNLPFGIKIRKNNNHNRKMIKYKIKYLILN